MASRFLTPFGGRGLLSRDPFMELHREVNRLFDDSFRSMQRRRRRIDAEPQGRRLPDRRRLGNHRRAAGSRREGHRPSPRWRPADHQRRKARRAQGRQNRLVERSYGSFTRSFQLPFTPDADKVEADCDKGVLTIKLPKSAEQDRSKKIAIRGGSGQHDRGLGTSGRGGDRQGVDEARSNRLQGRRASQGAGRKGPGRPGLASGCTAGPM